MEAPPSVISVMTPFPIHTSAETSIIAAQSLMKGYQVRHLPVEREGRVIGVVSEADLRTAEELTGSHDMPIGRLCTRPPLVVETDTPVRRVVAQMAEAGVDSAVVLRHGRLAGIVTLSEICEELLRRLPAPFVEGLPKDPGPEPEAA